MKQHSARVTGSARACILLCHLFLREDREKTNGFEHPKTVTRGFGMVSGRYVQSKVMGVVWPGLFENSGPQSLL